MVVAMHPACINAAAEHSEQATGLGHADHSINRPPPALSSYPAGLAHTAHNVSASSIITIINIIVSTPTRTRTRAHSTSANSPSIQVDDSLDPVESVLVYARSDITPQRHAYIKVR